MVGKQDFVAVARFRRALRRLLKFVENLALEEGITPQQHQLLLAVAGHPEREWSSVGELADALQLKHHATVGLVDRCQIAGLVDREQDPGDRRVVRVSLTEKGEGILQRITTRNIDNLRKIGELAAELQLVGSQASE